MTFKHRNLVDALPSHDWSIAKAALSLGYKESYAKFRLPVILATDVEFCQAVEKKRKEVMASAEWNIQEIQRQYHAVYDKCISKGDFTNAKGCLDSLARILGAFLDRQIIEDPAKARELSEKDEAEAKRIAKVLLEAPEVPTIKLRDCG